jgi:type IV pilus biogenesis protein PilP
MKSEHAVVRLEHALCVLAVALGLGVSTLARAASAPGTQQDPTAVPTQAQTAEAANQLMHLQEDTVVLKATLKKLDAQAQVAEREASIDRISNVPTYDDVRVTSIESLGRATSATLNLNDGSELEVHTGDTLPNGLRIVSIRPGSVLVENRSGKRTTLMVSSARLPTSNGASTLTPNLPPLPTSR